MKVSLITVSYNSERTIRDTFNSVLNQTYPNIEYIVVDGSSTDGTVDVIKEYVSRFGGRMRWISEPDKGLYDAMNKGILMTTGDIVGVINSDDFYHRTDIIEHVINAFKDTSTDSIFADVRYINSSNIDKTVRYYSSKNFSPKRFRYGFMPAHPTFFTYKKYFEQFGFYKTDYAIAADYELLIRFLYVHGLSYKYLPLDFLKMRTGGRSSLSVKNAIISNQEIVRACKENGIYTNIFILFFKYFVKVFELLNIQK
jgi:glycosyltransferase involved in cell wall biosynthesis